MRYKVIGPPGTGKTRRLLNEVHRYVKGGTALDRIGYFAFTRKAAREARDRYLDVNTHLTKRDIKYFQTLHSLAFNCLGLKEENVMQDLNYKAIGEKCGIQVRYAAYETNSWNGIFSSSSEYLTLINLARSKQITALEQFDRNEHLGKVERQKIDAIAKEIKDYKKVYGLIDYHDMLENFLERGKSPKFDVIFVDEAQDLSKIQWSIIEKLEKDNDMDIWVAGDDDQAIFGWAGAEVSSFINWKAEPIPLTRSERVPSQIQNKALNIINRVEENRISKDYLPKGEKGEIYQRYKLSDIDLTKGDWLILTRTNPLLKPIPAFLKRKGLFFETVDGNSMGKGLFEDVQNWNRLREGETLPEIQETRVRERIKDKKLTINEEWYDAFTNVADTKKEYLRSMLMNGEDLSKEPRIKVSTIHGAKGGEATNVVLFLNQTSNTMKASKKSKAKQDEEYRVWYVGVTRTIQNLYLIKCNNKQKEFII
jgi:DNA helicase-2/ATP-dependent DNA helicase PcrA